ncbi:hypothetical protein DSO57_1004551 [Entomophthora muscae]|uniref:Uncharacterized protein n=1 Tax=Entomophthora muscae TaxID=34485 RepID=A0ACC2SA76_9FUNG|nr:hypothetical protein DSO57_1004551 [Entomophthora muscae]
MPAVFFAHISCCNTSQSNSYTLPHDKPKLYLHILYTSKAIEILGLQRVGLKCAFELNISDPWSH